MADERQMLSPGDVRRMAPVEIGFRPGLGVQLPKDRLGRDLFFANPFLDETSCFSVRTVAPIDFFRFEQTGLLFDPAFDGCAHGVSFLEENRLIPQAASFCQRIGLYKTVEEK
jgi:hypothetical protein